MTFWAHLNCCLYGWRRLMSLPIRPKPLSKLPVVWRCPCHTFLLLLSVCVHLCVCALYSFMCLCMWLLVYDVSHQLLDDEVGSRSPKGCFGVTASHGSPGPDGLAIFLSSLCQSIKAGPNVVLSRSRDRERQDCKPVNIVVFRLRFDP